jgi:hypothetical protein
MEETIEPNETEKTIARKKRPARTILSVLFSIFIVIQFFQPDKNNNDVIATNDLHAMVSIPDTVEKILKVACYDCHTNNTRYPWYSNIQPVGWWLKNHIEEGKQHLNFNEFANIPPRNGKTTRERQLKKLENIKETISKGEMPLTSYTIIHTDARLTQEQKQLVMDWSDSAHQILSSLKKK